MRSTFFASSAYTIPKLPPVPISAVSSSSNSLLRLPLSAAWVLSDDEKRSLYDRFGEAGLQGEHDGSGSGSMGVDPFEVFDTFFGGYDLYLSFEESIFGGQREIEISCSEMCDNCDGTGAKSSSCIKSCSSCGGRGVMKTQKTLFGMTSISYALSRVIKLVSTCTKCGGDGKIITDYCRRYGDDGLVQSNRIMNVFIPAGASNGSTMQLQGEGNFDNKRGIADNLDIVLHIEEKHGIRRDGLNLYSTINVDYTEAILGTVIKKKSATTTTNRSFVGLCKDILLTGKNHCLLIVLGSFDIMVILPGIEKIEAASSLNQIRYLLLCAKNHAVLVTDDTTIKNGKTAVQVETVEGLRDLQIPSGIQPGETLKLSRMGVPDVNKPSIRGDHHFIVNVQIPKKISDAERALVEELSKASRKGYSVSSDSTAVRGNYVVSSQPNRCYKLPGKQSREGFAVVSFDTSTTLWRSRKQDPSLMVSIFTVFHYNMYLYLDRKD
ncbi:hypothetical protein FEM48_Zijuj05G0161300 [Ziziphus jujuba var. spinosa]|uniref:CR-type domain-containing protein n=1 Tax=Ziziphus jujuba var. spinosa TaxID=714518 RepID=A0A978VFT0_ZIZJJ|nr:hypothetical protein FEM48_Zijuj05G0161300 [Ziziphus jujuba var. spinosa]